jgi:toxin ParE1/3/4
LTAYRLSPAAVADLDDIWEFTVQQWSREQAERYVRQVEERLVGIAGGHVPVRSAADIRPGYYKCSVGSHMIYFRKEAEVVVVIRILHQSMDVVNRLRSP